MIVRCPRDDDEGGHIAAPCAATAEVRMSYPLA